MRRFLLIVYLTLTVCFAFAQSAQKADALFRAGQYKEAYAAYTHLLKAQPKSALYLYRVARCADELGHKQEAIIYFEKAGEKYALRNFYLGKLYQDAYRFDEAIEAYEKYLKTLTADNDAHRISQTEQLLSQARKGQRLIRRVADVTLLGKTFLPKAQFMQEYAEYLNPLGNQRLGSKQTDQHSDIYQQEKLLDDWTEAVLLPAPVNTKANEAFPFMLNDGLTLYFASTREQSLGGYDIYMTRYTGEHYLTPEQLGFPYNSFANDYMLAIDENEGVAYLASDRETPDSMICIYKLLWNNELKILRNIPEEQLRTIAKTFGKVSNVKPQPAQDIQELQEPQITQAVLDTQKFEILTTALWFVVNDSVVYESMDDFPNAETAMLYLQCDSLTQSIASQNLRLDNLREQYSALSKTENALAIDTLGNEILQLEATLPNEQKRLTDMLNELRLLIGKAYSNEYGL